MYPLFEGYGAGTGEQGSYEALASCEPSPLLSIDTLLKSEFVV